MPETTLDPARNNPEQTGPASTVVVLVLDETGSMADTVSDTIGAVNGYFETLAKDTPEARVSIMEFSDMLGQEENFRVLVADVAPAEVPKLTEKNYRPRGNTPLYDALGKAITETEEIGAERYLLVVMTDGKENASREWTIEGVKKLIERKQGEGWTIIYLGANQDAWAAGAALGVARGNTMSYRQTSRGVGQAAVALASATESFYTSSAVGSTTFFADAGQTEADYAEPDEDESKDST